MSLLSYTELTPRESRRPISENSPEDQTGVHLKDRPGGPRSLPKIASTVSGGRGKPRLLAMIFLCTHDSLFLFTEDEERGGEGEAMYPDTNELTM